LCRSFSAEAAFDTRDVAVTEDDSQALTAEEQEQELKRSTRTKKQAISKALHPVGRILDDSQHSIRQHDIPRGAWLALLKLRSAGSAYGLLVCSDTIWYLAWTFHA
jgi:hypothetical protein